MLPRAQQLGIWETGKSTLPEACQEMVLYLSSSIVTRLLLEGYFLLMEDRKPLSLKTQQTDLPYLLPLDAAQSYSA